MTVEPEVYQLTPSEAVMLAAVFVAIAVVWLLADFASGD